MAPLPFTLHPSPLTYDIIVSNPPYILNKERARMERNVLDYEPELALFVPDDDPLLFYRAIARYAIRALKPNGRLFFEINPLCVNDLQQMLNNEGFSHTEVRNDQFDKQRFIKSWR
jgi:release factor glutamine methyltransferase